MEFKITYDKYYKGYILVVKKPPMYFSVSTGFLQSILKVDKFKEYISEYNGTLKLATTYGETVPVFENYAMISAFLDKLEPYLVMAYLAQ